VRSIFASGGLVREALTLCIVRDERHGQVRTIRIQDCGSRLNNSHRFGHCSSPFLHVVARSTTDRMHNDSTSVKAYGRIPGTTRTGFFLAQGHSKDHRPDLKQLIYSLTISADGAVPVHYKTYPGNRTDDTTHIQTWTTLCGIAGRNDFLYVADCKVCSDEQLHHIVRYGGRVVTIMPDTWKESDQGECGTERHLYIWTNSAPSLYLIST
jgi:hypothetical protein